MKETPVGTAWGRPRRKSSLGLRRFGLVVGTIGALTVAPFVSMGVAGASAPTTPKAVTEALNVVSRSFGSVTTLKIQTGSVQTSVATTESAASAKTGQQEGETRWTIEARANLSSASWSQPAHMSSSVPGRQVPEREPSGSSRYPTRQLPPRPPRRAHWSPQAQAKRDHLRRPAGSSQLQQQDQEQVSASPSSMRRLLREKASFTRPARAAMSRRR